MVLKFYRLYNFYSIRKYITSLTLAELVPVSSASYSYKCRFVAKTWSQLPLSHMFSLLFPTTKSIFTNKYVAFLTICYIYYLNMHQMEVDMTLSTGKKIPANFKQSTQ